MPKNYNASSLKDQGVTAYYVNKKLVEIGKIEMTTPFGRTIMAYDLERTICDIFRKRNTMDIDATIKNYPLNEDNIRIAFEEILSLNVNDEITFRLKNN